MSPFEQLLVRRSCRRKLWTIKEMDLLLTHGYFLHEDSHELKVMRPYPPLGILYLSSYLKSRGFSVGVFDSTFRTREDFYRCVERSRPPVIGIYCNLLTKQSVLDMMRFCRRQACTLVLGGPEPPHYAEEYLARGADVVVVGEGEITLQELLPALVTYGRHRLEHVNGIVFRDLEGRVARTPVRPYIDDLSGQPLPDRTAINIAQYVDAWRQHHGMGSVSLITSRGCPYTCTWCSHSVFGFSHRRRTPEDVAAEVELIVADYSPDMLWYADDVFTIHHRWISAYAAELRRRNLRVPFECISREDRLNEDVIHTLAEMGCMRLWIGSESGSQRILDAMQRRTSARRVREVTHLLKRHGIQAGMFIMLGYEGEDRHDLSETVDLLKKANPDLFLTTVAYPIKGTRYYEEVADRVVAPGDWETRSDRDLAVAGRPTRRYYEYANRWIVNEVALHRQRTDSSRNYLRLLKTYTNTKIGKFGMALTRHQREPSPRS